MGFNCYCLSLKNDNLAEITSQAESLLLPLAFPICNCDRVKEGAVVIDVGINSIEDPTKPRAPDLWEMLLLRGQSKSLIHYTCTGGSRTHDHCNANGKYVNAARLQNGLSELKI
ncbi:MAG: hypothetical protein CM1200mP30_04470 [Pseudomonadota bacterium]|nr:MAG: hypothetical protein CM1200mP30_04470 [Pseudomonadota bacterium]